MLLVGDLLENVKKYYESEYEETKSVIERNPWWIESAEETVWLAVQRCLGVAQFAQVCDVDFSDVDILYMEVKEKLEKLLERD